MAIPPKDPAANSNLCETGNARNDAFSQPITNFENHSDVMDTSGTIPADSPRTGRHRRAANPPLPSNVEIIDLDFLPEPKPFIKSEDDDCVFIKSEFTDDSIAKGAIKWPNTEDNPIILDDDEAPPPAPPPAPILRPPFKETKGNASPHLNDMPMADQLVQGVPTPREKPAVPRAGDEMEVKSAASSSHAQSLGQAPAATIASTNSGTLDLGTSTLTPRGRIMGAGLRDKLRKIQQKSKANLQEKRNQPTSGGRPSSAPRAPAAPSTPPVLAISTPTAGPSIPSAAPVAQPFENEVSFNDIVAEHAMLDDQIQDPLEREFPNDYLDAVQRFKEEKKEYEKRRAAVKSDLEDEIQIMQQQSKMDNWRKRLMEDRQHDNPPEHDSLFMPGEFHGPFAEYGDEMSDRDDFQSGPGQLLEAELQAKPRGRPKGSSSKKDTSAKSKSSKPSKGKTGNDKVKDKNAKVSKKAAKSKGKGGPRNKGPSMFDYGSLFTGNVIRDAQGNQGRAQLPLMSSTRKADALKALVASVPQEHRKMAQVDRNYLDSACKDFVGRMSVRAHPGSDGWVVTGMTCILKHHQLLGAAFMRRRERGDEKPRGGICADQMGLGKTIMMLANIVNGRPRGYEGPKTTLIVATPALITQWMGEINKHTSQERKGNWRPLRVLKWHGSSKPVTNDRYGGIPEFDIVLTTFDEVRKSYPKQDFPIHLQTRQDRDAWWQEFYDKNKGVLHEVEFLRVVLDEAQAIKNYKSHTSMACRGLQARHRWALSGTPIQNAVRELFPYFKFLGVEHTGTYKIFCSNFIGTNSDGSMCTVGLDRLHSFLSRFMIRRTHADQLMGAPIVTLPKASERIYWCRFNNLERSIYEMVRARMIQRINRLSRSRQLENNYSNVLTMLLRLRQLTGHLLALEQPMKDLLEKEDHEKIYDLAREAIANHRSTHETHMRGLRETLYRPDNEHDKAPHSAGMPGVHTNGEDNEADDRADSALGSPKRRNCSNTGRHHGSKFDFLMYLKDLKDGIAGRNSDLRTACNFCNDIAEEPWKTQCYHVYCRRCLERMQEEAALKDQPGARCVVCQTVFSCSEPCNKMNFDQNNGSNGSDSGGSDDSDHELLRKTRGKGRGKKARTEKSKDWIDLAGGNDILPSSKTLAIKAQIINWLEEDENMKIIIYTQFIDMIRILSKVCSAEKWPHSLYHGGKSHEARDEAIREFSENPDMRIMLASLRCGGVGLNLTMAQKVIVVDPWWNSSIEQQAFCRVFRIGQESETSMTRFVVEKTVDENMIRMQERKQKEIDDVMDGDKQRKLTIPELLRLFGEVEDDEDGNPFILVENRETLPNPNGDLDDEGFNED